MHNPQVEFLTLKTTNTMKRLLIILSIAAGLTIAGCGSDDSGHTHGDDTHTHAHETKQQALNNTDAAHQHEGEEHSHSGENTHSHEEDNAMLGLDETYQQVRKGIRLTLSYDSEASSFTGMVENTTQDALTSVSAGVKLSNGTELGPTSPVDLSSGESQSIELDADGETFDRWKAHSEMRSGGHTHDEDGDHQHQH